MFNDLTIIFCLSNEKWSAYQLSALVDFAWVKINHIENRDLFLPCKRRLRIWCIVFSPLVLFFPFLPCGGPAFGFPYAYISPDLG